MSGPTARARLAGSVHGVVVQASSTSPVGAPASSSELEADRERRVLAVEVDVVHPRLGVAERGLAPPAVRQHLEPLVHQALVPQRLERPHDALHVVEVERLVVVLEVDPAGLAGDVALPLGGVAQHAGAAGVVEVGDAEGGDLGVPGDAQLALGLDLGGQAVAVPAEAAVDELAAHRLVARHGVLDEPGQQVAVVRQPVGERWTVVEDELVGALGLAADDRLEERPVLAPTRSRMRSSRAGKLGCESTLGYAIGAVSCGVICPQGRLAAPLQRAAIPPCLPATAVADHSTCAGDDGPDPFGSTGTPHGEIAWGRPVLPKARR